MLDHPLDWPASSARSAGSPVSRRVRSSRLSRYAAQDTWARDPLLRRSAFDALQTILLGGGFIRRRHRYEDRVDTGLARQVMAADES